MTYHIDFDAIIQSLASCSTLLSACLEFTLYTAGGVFIFCVETRECFKSDPLYFGHVNCTQSTPLLSPWRLRALLIIFFIFNNLFLLSNTDATQSSHCV